MRDAGMRNIQQEHQKILKHVPSGSTVAYLDYPVHTNIGDLLIMAGTLKFFQRYGINVGCMANAYNFSEKKKKDVEKCDIIVLHGGGNFGDLYDDHQSFREHILNLFPKKPTVIFPQTIHFTSERNISKAALAFQDKSHIMLFVRDLDSLRIARSNFVDGAELMPDMAHQLWDDFDFFRNARDMQKREFIIRTDKERGSVPNYFLPYQNEFRDWDAINSSSGKFGIKLFRRILKLVSKLSHGSSIDVTYTKFANSVISSTTKEISRASILITSRLHGGILGTLLDVPIIMIDNNNGKLLKYFEAWEQFLQPVILLTCPGDQADSPFIEELLGSDRALSEPRYRAIAEQLRHRAFGSAEQQA